MPEFSARSRERLLTCHKDIQTLFNDVIRHRDCTIIWGRRGKEAQNEAFRTGNSKLRYPYSLHNGVWGPHTEDNPGPSLAVDVMPYFDCEPHIRWDDTFSVYEFSGFVKGRAIAHGIEIINGYDWDNDFDFHDQTLMDGAHYQLVNW